MNLRHPRAIVIGIWSLVLTFAIVQLIAWTAFGGTSHGSIVVLQFVIAWSQTSGSDSLAGLDTWDIDIPDAGHIDGTWKTQVSGIANCTATYSLHGQR